jgi:hypothetical protein
MLLKRWVLATILAGTLAALGAAQDPPKFLTNDDVVSMVKAGQEEGTILNAVQNQGTDFDVSAKAVLKLKKSGVSKRVIDAMISIVKEQKEAAAAVITLAQDKAAAEEAEEKAEAAKEEAARAARAAARSAAATAATPGQPTVVVLQGEQRQALTIAHTQIVPTQSQSSSLDGLAKDGSLTSSLTSVMQNLTMSGLMKPGGSGIGSMAMAANPILGPAMIGMSLFAKHKAASTPVTDVWAIPGQKSETVVHNKQATFDVQFDAIPGINVDEYEPILIRLQTSQANSRLVGATTATPREMQSSSADWNLYASFMEQRVPAQATKVGPGHYWLQPSSGLGQGEYGIVLRPINKQKKFSGSNVGQNIGDGLVFNCVWSFGVQ